MLRIHNSLTGKKEDFQPLDAGKVRMYVCGITAYDYCHLGHARAMLAFDVVVRYLRSRGLQVTYARNITDIDDKIIKRAKENGEAVGALTERFIAEMNRDADALGVMRPDLEPRATEHIPAIIVMIERLIERGLAYKAENNDVYYSVSRFPEYGRLSGKQLDELRAGARVEVQEMKADPLDFVLWKAAKPGEPSWDSPWGPGRPGWHIECSAMSTRCLGDHFDIHGGGQDLLFPHHENEIAQSCGATGARFVNYWMHNGFVRVDNEKMSKSLANFFTVREILARFQPEVVRYLIVASHYRSPLNYSDESLVEARASLSRLYTALRGIGTATEPLVSQFVDEFNTAMDDDFNTPKAIAVLHMAAGELNRVPDKRGAQARALVATLKQLGAVLGLLQDDPVAFLQSGGGDHAQLTPGHIETMIEARTAARARRDFKEADRIRDHLKEQGVELSDGPGKTIWTRV